MDASGFLNRFGAPSTSTQRDGRRILSSRVFHAANRVCNPGSFDGGLSQGEQIGCFQGAMSEARPQIDLAARRAREIASKGWSDLPLVTLAVAARF